MHMEIPQIPKQDYTLSNLSSKAVHETFWHSQDFTLAAGLCILEPISGCAGRHTECCYSCEICAHLILAFEVVVNDRHDPSHWFLPRGRKDIGESLEETALREGFEVRIC